jgi:hypothetical protein
LTKLLAVIENGAAALARVAVEPIDGVQPRLLTLPVQYVDGASGNRR